MTRTVAWTGEMKMGDCSFVPQFQPAFGKVITNPHQLKDELKKEKYEKGVELIEVGNDRQTSGPQRKAYDHDAAGYYLNSILRKQRGRIS